MAQEHCTNFCEALESRIALSASPLSISVLPTDGGNELLIKATPGNDRLRIRPLANGLALSNGAFSTTLSGSYKRLTIRAGRGNDSIVLHRALRIDAVIYGEAGADTLVGGSGNDRLYGGLGNDRSNGAAGNDQLIDIGGGLGDLLTGGPGLDSFWLDARLAEKVTDPSAAETRLGAVHRVGAFFTPTAVTEPDSTLRLGAIPKNLLGQKLPDPGASGQTLTYKNFSRRPLFASTGPSPDDVYQGDIGDCYLLAALSAVARSNPKAITQSMADLGDGTYAVQFTRGGQRHFVRVDGDLPVMNNGQPLYAGLGNQDSIWVAIYEKAYAVFRRGSASYDSLDGGWMSEVNAAMGLYSRDVDGFASGEELLAWTGRELAAGRAVTFATAQPNGAPLLSYHGYSVDSVELDETGQPWAFWLRNPWGYDGVDNPTYDDGYVLVTAAEALASYSALTSAG